VTKNFPSILVRLPEHEFRIRNRWAHDEDFRSLCSDYELAAAAYRHWQNAGEYGAKLLPDYQSIMQELEAEILECLECPGKSERAR